MRPGDILRKPVKEVNVTSVVFSPSGRSFVLVTTEGILEFSKDETEMFLPMNLSLEATKPNIISELVKEHYTNAFLLAL